MSNAPQVELPSPEGGEPLIFVKGRDVVGQWIVVERHGLYGGIFGSKAAAAQYAKFESGGRRSIVSISVEPLDFYGAARNAA